MNTYMDPHLVNGATHTMVSQPSSRKAVQSSPVNTGFGTLLDAAREERSTTIDRAFGNEEMEAMTLAATQQNQEAEIQRTKSGDEALQLARMVMHFF